MNKTSTPPLATGRIFQDKYYRELLGKNILRLALSYLAPLLLLSIYFNSQYHSNYEESRRLHLKSIAEYEVNMLDLFLRERVVNLINIIEDPRFQVPPSASVMEGYLQKLTMNSKTFLDVGFFDSTGVQTAYAGPLPYLEMKDYSHEAWFKDLKQAGNHYVITDIYMGLRQKPHFTIAVSRIIGGQYLVMRATLDPQKFYDYIASLEGSSEVNISMVNREGLYQLVTPPLGALLHSSGMTPPHEPRIGMAEGESLGNRIEYAYAWLNSAHWAVIVRWAEGKNVSFIRFGNQLSILAISIAIILVVISVIIIRSKKLVEMEIEKETVKAQFEHAAKLASVGELSAGVAHEINNPLAIISEEVGLIKDLMNPEFCQNTTFDDLTPHLDNIHDAVFRCRDITRKLLSFVRKTDIKLMPHDANQLIQEIVDTFWIREMEVSNIEIITHYQPNLPKIVTDANQLKQVFLNILNNAFDAISPPGRITINTTSDNGHIIVTIADTGKGITQEEIEKIFMPFFTTKEVGKGTGLGLSVSLGIIKSLGGKISVESIPGKGAAFSIILPYK
ncbi:MAG: ATP-binding protein [bacterium]|nr:ATP-binding protein [bacterium]